MSVFADTPRPLSTEAHNIKMQERMRRFGVESDVLDAAEISRRFPLMSTDAYPLVNDDGDEVQSTASTPLMPYTELPPPCSLDGLSPAQPLVLRLSVPMHLCLW